MARRFGYSRVSTSDQDWSLQLEALTRAGVDDRDIFREKASGANRQRTELRRMLDQLRPGDQATVYRLDRLARSQLHLLQIMEEIESKGAKLVSLRARPAKWRGLGSTYDPVRFHLLHGGFNESEVRAHQRLLKSSAGHNFASTSRVSIFSRTGSKGQHRHGHRDRKDGGGRAGGF